jgi:HAD superfamily hydrolase (TIGR01459 family)
MKHTTLEDLACQFDAFFVDQFGVLMDASSPYPFAINAIKKLSEYNKPIVLLSNSGKRAKQNCERLDRLGFELNLFTAVITSGEVAYWTFKNKFDNESRLKPKIYLISRDADKSPIKGLSCEIAENTNEADYLLIAGSESDRRPLNHYISLLEPMANKGVPAFCTNPDLIMLTPNGTSFGPGLIAKEYEKMGGIVTWFGKPHPLIYKFALDKIPKIEPQKVLCIGDSLEHDIRGGYFANCKRALVRSGIHSKTNLKKLTKSLEGSDIPDFVVLNFSFS